MAVTVWPDLPAGLLRWHFASLIGAHSRLGLMAEALYYSLLATTAPIVKENFL